MSRLLTFTLLSAAALACGVGPDPAQPLKPAGGLGAKLRVESPPVVGSLRFISAVIRSGTVAIDLDLTGAKNLTLVADDAGDGKSCDWANWLDPILTTADGKEIRLTELKPAIASFDTGELRTNENYKNLPLRSGGKVYANGLGGHANMRLTYDIAGRGFTKFTALAGLDDGARELGGALHKSKAASIQIRVCHDAPPPEAAPGGSTPDEISKLDGNAQRGRNLFFGGGTCASCHVIGGRGGDVGPDLSSVGKRSDRRALIESIIEPSAVIPAGFEPIIIETKDGTPNLGFTIADGDVVVLKDSGGQRHNIEKRDIVSRKLHPYSLMPPFGQILSRQQIADLAAFLQTQGRH